MAARPLLLASLILAAGCGAPPVPAESPNGTYKSGEAGGGQKRTALLDDSAPKDDGNASAGDKMEKAQGLGTALDRPKEGQGAPGGAAGDHDKKGAGSPPPPPTGIRSAVVDSTTSLGNGRLTQEQIAKILEKGGDVFGECYTLGAGGAHKDFRGTVAVKAAIGPTRN